MASLQRQAELVDGNSLEVFPNPNDGHFNLIFLTENSSSYILKIFNTLGQVVYHETLKDFSGSYSRKIDLSEFGKGVYNISIQDAGGIMVRKVITY